MQNKVEHTLTPWRLKYVKRDEPDGPHYRRYIAICPTNGNSVLAHVNLCAGNPLAVNDTAGEANAAFIVKACNEHAALNAVAEAAEHADCGCTVKERYSGHRSGCVMESIHECLATFQSIRKGARE